MAFQFISVSPVQFSNAESSIFVMLSGMVIEISPVSPLNAFSPIVVTLPSAGITLPLQPKIKVWFSASIMQFPALR